MATITLPDPDAFNADSDKISESRAELKTIADAIVEMGGDWNDNGGNFGTGGGGISNVVEDTTPQLGGDLDINSQKIVSTSNGNIELEPNGTGDIVLDATEVKLGDGTASVAVETIGATNLTLSINEGVDNNIKIRTDRIELDADDSGDPIYLNGAVKFKDIGGTPGDTATVARYLQVTVDEESAGGITYYLPLYK